MVEKLKPCPFCGSEAFLRLPNLPMTADCDDVQVSCGSCDASGPSILFDQDAHGENDLPGLASEAIAAWNTRTPSRNDVLEEAAKVVDEHGEAWGLSYRSMTDNIAAAIRARKDQTDG